MVVVVVVLHLCDNCGVTYRSMLVSRCLSCCCVCMQHASIITGPAVVNRDATCVGSSAWPPC
jgi:hypothetical protein